jgi:hypothetical protein
MLRGLLALGLAMCVIGAPMATDLCQATCATRSADAASDPAGAHHSCHGEAPTSGVSLIALHACGHADALPGSDRPEHASSVLAIAPALVIVDVPIKSAPVSGASSQDSPPPLLASTAQLRV